MIRIPITKTWNISKPTVYRYLPKKYVDSFFKDGSLRLSSFKQFKKHNNEQKLDGKEGEINFIHRNNSGAGQTIQVWSRHGLNSYLLCGTTVYDEDMMKEFQCDSYIRINDITNFAIAISNHIPAFVEGAEGICDYKNKRIVEKDLGVIDLNRFKSEGEVNRFLLEKMKFFPCFLKEKKYAKQSEYRLIWHINQEVNDYIDIKVPEARQFCDRGSELETK